MAEAGLQLEGGCHCGNIRLHLDWPGEDGPQAFRHCTCSFCTRHNARYAAHPDAKLGIDISSDASVNRYRFGTGTADFLVCRNCGVLVVATCEDGGSLMAVVNVNTLDNFTIDSEVVLPVSFDGEEVGDRLGRRRKTWIGNVLIT